MGSGDLTRIVAAIPVGIAVLDRELRYVAASQRWLELAGRTGELVGRHHYDVFPEIPERWKEVHRRCLAGASESCDEDRFDRLDGTTQWIRWQVEPWRDDAGAVAGIVICCDDITARKLGEDAVRDGSLRVVGTCQDITAHKLAQDELTGSREDLAAVARGLIAILERERRHLASVLHDELGQSLTAIHLGLQRARVASPSAIASTLDELEPMVVRAIEQTRSAALNLRPAILDDLGLGDALDWHLRQQQRAGLEVVSRIEITAPLSTEVSSACYRVVQEAVGNALRHGRPSCLWVDVAVSVGAVTMTIRDNGVGFDLATLRASARAGTHLGALIMRERVELLGGRFSLESAPGAGTTVRASIPLPEAT